MAPHRLDAGHVQAMLDEVTPETAQDRDRGAVADYIPALSVISPDHFAIAVALAGGRVWSAGDADCRFSLQSISKVFTLAIALQPTIRSGRFDPAPRMGRRPNPADAISPPETGRFIRDQEKSAIAPRVLLR